MVSITVDNFSEADKYVKSVKLNGKEIKNNLITHSQIIISGGIFEFEMTDVTIA